MDDTVEGLTEEKKELEYKETFSLSKFARQNGTQLGIFVVFILLWALFIFGAPDTFLSGNIYWAFMATIPFFAIMAMPLTIAVIAASVTTVVLMDDEPAANLGATLEQRLAKDAIEEQQQLTRIGRRE